jgi:hypothetical protein
MDENTISKDLWSAANLITGFAIAQTITFSYACAKPEFGDSINTFWVKVIISMIMILITLLQSFAVWWCAKKQITLIGINSKENNSTSNNLEIQRIIRHAAYGRIFVISLLLIPTLLALYARQLGGMPFNLNGTL